MRGRHLISHPSLSARRAAAASALTLALAACGGGGDSDGYGPDERDDFVEACAPGAGDEACGCFYDRLAEQVPHDRFEEVDEQIRDDPRAIPDDIAALAIECSAVQPDTGD